MHAYMHALHLQIDQIRAVSQGVGDASIQHIIIQISEEKIPTPTCFLCLHDAMTPYRSKLYLQQHKVKDFNRGVCEVFGTQMCGPSRL